MSKHNEPTTCGFALVLALSLMAFVLLLVLSLSTLLRVESASSTQRLKLAQAQQNALLAIGEALGHLQATAGADQRITATGGLWDSPADGTANLVGVWNSSDLDGNGLPDGSFERWLVSSRESIDVSDINFVSEALPVGTDGSKYVSLDDSYALMVGSGSVSPDANRPNLIPGVVAEMKPILSSNGTVSGQYAWWIGDEGSKARFNLLDSFAFDLVDDIGSSPWEDSRLRNERIFQSMQGTGLSVLSQFNNLDISNGSEASKKMNRLFSLGHIPILDPNALGLSEAAKVHFHDLTSYSMGLQTNAREGGFKRDLSLLFEQSNEDFGSASSTFMQALGSEGLIYTGAPGSKPILPLTFKEPVGDGREIYGPSWDLMRDYYRLYKGVAGSASSAPSKRVLPRNWVHTYAPGKSWFLNSGLAGNEQEAWIRSLGQLAWRNFGSLESTDTNATYNRVKTNSFKEGRSIAKVEAVRATSGAYLPYLSRFTIFYSTVAVPNGGNYDLDIVIQPFIAMHNPYNVSIQAPRMRFLQELDRFEVFVRRDDGNEWDPSVPFRTGNPSASDPKFQGNVYRFADPASNAGQSLGQSALFVNSANNDPKAFGALGRELSYELGETEYAPGEVKLFAAGEVAQFSQREVNLQEFGGGYLPTNGIYLGLPDVPLYVDHDQSETTPRLELVNSVAADESILLQIVMDAYISMAYEVFNSENNAFDSAGSYFHATDKMAGGQVLQLQRTLPQLINESATAYVNSLGFVDSYSAAPVPHLVIDNFIKPLEYSEMLGQSNSLTSQQRTFPNFIVSNPLAASFSHTATAGREGNGLGNMMHTAGFRVSPDSGGIPVQDLFDGDRGTWGNNNGRFGQKNTVLLEIPGAPLQSLGQLQHASLNPSPYYPALSVGQSFRSPYLENAGSVVHAFSDSTYASGQQFVFHDQNFLINEALWDGYYFSSIAPQPDDLSYGATAPSLAQDPFVSDLPAVVDAFMQGEEALGNSRMVFLPWLNDSAVARSELLNPMTSARHLAVNGSFNINSTSVQAWQVFLAGYRNLAVQYFDASSESYKLDTDSTGSLFSRLAMPGGASSDSNTSINSAAAWSGFLRLKDEEIESLAESIVDEIKARAAARGTTGSPQPAMGLAQFINRMPGVSGFEEVGLLQAAIDTSGINNARATTSSEFNTATYNASGSDYTDASFSLNTAAVAPLSLNQGDLLQAIGPAISARSDTFRVRAYGEAVDGFGETTRVWCEAIFQRSTEFIDSNDFQRRFELISFRWLSPDEV